MSSYKSHLISKPEFYSFIKRITRNKEVSFSAKVFAIVVSWWEHADRLGIKDQRFRDLAAKMYQIEVMNEDGTVKKEIQDEINHLLIVDRVFKADTLHKKFNVKSQQGRAYNIKTICGGARYRNAGQRGYVHEYSVSPALSGNY